MNIQFSTPYVRTRHLRLSFFLFLNFVLHLDACSLWGQVMQKKVLTTTDYSKWGQLTLDKIKPDGLWVSYTVKYESGLDTLFVKNTKSMQTYSFPLANNGNFIDENWFICRTTKALLLFNLKNARQEEVVDASQYSYCPKTKHLALLITPKGKDKEPVSYTHLTLPTTPYV